MDTDDENQKRRGQEERGCEEDDQAQGGTGALGSALRPEPAQPLGNLCTYVMLNAVARTADQKPSVFVEGETSRIIAAPPVYGLVGTEEREDGSSSAVEQSIEGGWADTVTKLSR